MIREESPWAPDNTAAQQRKARRRQRDTVLHLTSMWSTKYGGLERYFVELARQCSAQGYRSVFQYNKMPESPLYLRDLKEHGAQVLVVPLDRGRLDGVAQALRLVIRLKPDVVHMHFAGLPIILAVGLLGHRLGVRRVLSTVHCVPGFTSKTFARLAYGQVDGVLCVSRAVELVLASVGALRPLLRTHYLGVSAGRVLPTDVRGTVRKELAIPSEASVLVVVGFPMREKGLDVALDAFADCLADAQPDLHLVVVGVRPQQRTLVSPKADSVPGRIHWVGIRDDVRPYLVASDVFAQPSRSEGLPLTILEALVQSLPVVASRVGGIPEVICDGENGLLVPPESPRDLAAAVSRLLDDTPLAARLARAGHETWRQKFDLAASVDVLTRDHYQFGP